MKKKGLYILGAILLLLIVTNPSMKAFKDYSDFDLTDSVYRDKNFFVFSVYVKNKGIYYGAIGNFIKVKNEEKKAPEFIPVKYSLLEIYNKLMKVGYNTESLGSFQVFAENMESKIYGAIIYQLLQKAGYHDMGTMNQFLKTFCQT